jgi:hypothetical protein
LLFVDGCYGAFPAGQRFLEVDVYDVLDVVTVAGEEGMWFLLP